MASILRSRGASSVRGYASASKPIVHPPIQLHSLSGRYAGALYSAVATESTDLLPKVEADLSVISQTIKSNPNFQIFLANPTLSPKTRVDGISDVFKITSRTPTEPVKRLFELLGESGRLNETEKIIKDFSDIMSAHRGEVKVTITTAQPLEKDLQTRLESSLKNSIAASKGKSLKITNHVSPSILGGLIIDFEDQTIDLSVSSQVNKLNATIAVPV